MDSSTARRRLLVSVTLFGCGLAISAWQAEEHMRFTRAASDAIIHRGRDITSTLGVVIKSQRRFVAVSKDRLQSALQDLVRSGEVDSLAILGATGETIASAGQPVELTPEMLRARGVYWRETSVTIMNLMDLGSTTTEDGSRPRTTVVVTDERMSRAFRSPYGMPSWMTKEEYDSIIQKQGVTSLVISMSTDAMHRAVMSDLLLRSLVSLLAMGGAVISILAWRNVVKNSELQIRLVKAGETNTHLKEMNFAAAGLAHETRNPLNLIRGLAQMIAMQAESSPKLKEHASTIVEEVDRVTVQLNEFINYSKPREAHFAPVEIQHLVADVARTLLPDIEEKQIRLVQPESAFAVEADEPLLRQALFNVLLNAVQAVAPGGQIVIRLTAVDARSATLEISDDGPGVPAADRSSIFKPYVTMRQKGVGLGLAIVQQIVSAHRWEIACEANEPHGARFRFSGLKIAAQPA